MGAVLYFSSSFGDAQLSAVKITQLGSLSYSVVTLCLTFCCCCCVFLQFVGYNDEILDVCFAGGDQTHLAVATNSSEWKVYNLDTMNCQLLEGHTDIVLSLEVNDRGDMLVTGSKVLYPYNNFFLYLL